MAAAEGEGEMTNKEQYDADVATGYPRPWELWKYFDKEIGNWRRIPVPTTGERWCLTYCRLPHADRLIARWRKIKDLPKLEW